LIEGKRKWHRPERTLPRPPEGSVPNASGTPPSGGSNPETSSSPRNGRTPPSGGSGSSFLGWHERGYLPHFDTLIRDEEHLKRAIHYTENNPVKAALVAERKAWQWGSARWRDESERRSWQRDGAAA
jgi:hypothetical protein